MTRLVRHGSAGAMLVILAMLMLPSAIVIAGPALAETAQGTAWHEEPEVRVRIIDAGPTGQGTHRLGFEIDLTDGWKTYWRHPGETGVAPHFDWSQSFNVADVTARFPAPKRFIDGGAVSFGYKTDVVLPLEVTLNNPGPALVQLDVTYAVCADICLPLQASFELALNTAPDLRSKFLVERALRSVPQASAPDALESGLVVQPQGDAILAVTVPLAGGDPDAIDVFAEGPEGWHLPPLELVSQNESGKVFSLDLSGLPEPQSDQDAALRLTVVHPAGAFEQAVPLP